MSRFVLVANATHLEPAVEPPPPPAPDPSAKTDLVIHLGAIHPGGLVDLVIDPFDAEKTNQLTGLHAVYYPGTPPTTADGEWFFKNSPLQGKAAPEQLVAGNLTITVPSVPGGAEYWVQVIAEYPDAA